MVGAPGSSGEPQGRVAAPPAAAPCQGQPLFAKGVRSGPASSLPCSQQGPTAGLPRRSAGARARGRVTRGGSGSQHPLGSVPGGLRTCPAHHTVASPPSFLARSWESAARHGKLQQRWGRISPPHTPKIPTPGPHRDASTGTAAPRGHPRGSSPVPSPTGVPDHHVPAPQVALPPRGGVPGVPQQGQALGSPGQDPARWC